ncbi:MULTISPECIES: DUF4169 family protein [Nitratireductor]|uniref:DUF4169 family protein n=1 Tax=Nitratireductor TaxID=245876 RepID=UPI000D0CE0B0|nr:MULTISPECIES: DUF4169 family protein [Nitratireductor]PSM17811.1 DUF4169 domain-containing protein [Nitratireductor sp. StC3]
MAEIVNLRLARKRAERAAREKRASENRARHGRTKTEKQTEARTERTARAALDGHRRDKPQGDDRP